MENIKEFPSIHSHVFNADGSIGFFEKFFAHRGRTYRVIRHPYIVENMKYHAEKSTLFKVCKIFSYITIFGIFFIYIGKLIQRKFKKYIFLPEEIHPEVKYMTIRQRKMALEKDMRNNQSLQTCELSAHLNLECKTLYRSMSKCIQIKIRPQLDLIFKDQMLMKRAWAKVESLCDNSSLLNSKQKKRVIKKITEEEGIEFGIKKVIINRMEKYPNTENADIALFIKHPDTATKILYYQMLHIMALSENKHDHSLQFQKKIQFFKEVEATPDIKKILYKKEPIQSIQNKICSLLKTLQKKKNFELRFLRKKNAQQDHSIFVQADQKGVRFYDEYLGLSHWLEVEQLADFIKSRMLWDKNFPLCIMMT